tara:strand:+ start:471 stop:650 length:180 start_codon:yes stop_codon:yes gene_type:complete
MKTTLHSSYVYPEIVIHSSLELMTKLTEYISPAKQEAKVEAQISNAEARVLRKNGTNVF